MFRYTAEILPYHDYPLEDSIRELAEIGFTEVNLWSSASPLASHVNPGDDPGKILSVLDRYNMKPCGLTMYGKDQQQMLERIEFARELGIDTVIFDCEANYSEFVSTFLPPLVQAAERNGVRIAVENHLTVPFSADFEAGGNEDKRWDEGVDSLDQIKRLIADIDHPNLGCLRGPTAPVGNGRDDQRRDHLPCRAQTPLLLLHLGHRSGLPARCRRPKFRSRRKAATPSRRPPRPYCPARGAEASGVRRAGQPEMSWHARLVDGQGHQRAGGGRCLRAVLLSAHITRRHR